MMSDEEFLEHIKNCISNYKGDITHMNEAVGLMVVGRYMGWKHQRLISNQQVWMFAKKVFGDPKDPRFMLERTAMGNRKSVALFIADEIGGFVAVLKRKVSFPFSKRRIFQ